MSYTNLQWVSGPRVGLRIGRTTKTVEQALEHDGPVIIVAANDVSAEHILKMIWDRSSDRRSVDVRVMTLDDIENQRHRGLRTKVLMDHHAAETLIDRWQMQNNLMSWEDPA